MPGMNVLFQKSHQRAFGTWPLKKDELAAAITTALGVGYRAFDTAQMYGNEADLGEVLASSGVARVDLCLITKVHPNNYEPAKFLASVEQSLKDLRVSAVDALLLHWPPVEGGIAAPLRLLQDALNRGLARNIGISNHTSAMMREAKSIVDAPLVINQVEFHPLLNQDKLLAAAAETGIPLMAYSSIARGRIFDYPLFANIAAAYGKTAGQAALRWIVQKGVVVNTMSTKPDNIRANFDIMDFTLSSVDMAKIEALTRTNFRVVTKARVPWAPDWD
jgi:2,5-diketo-D-gluconate reductase B